MKTPIIITTAITMSVAILTTGCESQRSAQFIADHLMPQFHYSGPGGSRTYRVPASAFYSPTLKFKEAVVKNDVANVARYIKPNLVEEPINGLPPIYYAAINGNTSMIRLLLRNGASAQRRFGGRSLTYVAASHGQFGTAADLAAMGAGTSGDISRGRALYAENAAIQRRQAAEFTAAAVRFIDAAIRSNPGPSGGRDEFGNTQHDYNVMSLHDRAH